MTLRLGWLLLLLLIAGCRAPDVSTDEGARQAYAREVGREIEDDSFCVERPADLQDVVLVGEFVLDAGCRYGGVYVEGKFGDRRAMTPAGLRHNGWDDVEQRADLALAWTSDIIYAEDEVVQSAGEAFTLAERPYQPPRAEPQPDGGVLVTLWVMVPNAMAREDAYYLRDLAFQADGSLVSERVLDEFQINYRDEDPALAPS